MSGVGEPEGLGGRHVNDGEGELVLIETEESEREVAGLIAENGLKGSH